MKFRSKKQKLNRQVFPFKIKCTCCANFHQNSDNWDQGHYCASYIYQSEDKTTYIQCEYGSGYDTMRFIIKNQNIVKKKHLVAANKKVKSNDKDIVVCDKCIARYIKNGFIVEDKSYDPFACIDELNSFHAEDPQRYYEIMKEGPEHCIRLIREERAKPLEQRIKEREGKPEIKLVLLKHEGWIDWTEFLK